MNTLPRNAVSRDLSPSLVPGWALMALHPFYFIPTAVENIFFSTFTSFAVLSQPLVRNLPERFDGTVAVARADVDKAAELADEHEVTTIPHFILLKNGVQVCAHGFCYFRIDLADWLGNETRRSYDSGIKCHLNASGSVGSFRVMH